MNKILSTTILTLFMLGFISLKAQETLTQTVRGVVTDKESKSPLLGATVQILGLDAPLGSTTDEQGRFKITNVPIGRRTIKASFIGYNEVQIPNIIVNSGKEVILNIELQESVLNKEEIVITADRNKDKANNEMALVSARRFTIDETQRYAGSLGDPARMVANFAGVSAPSDQRNDIIIRGNSPQGLLWRVEGVDIPSPNHFSAQGTTGGPVSILNNNTLRNSDFFTGAWPAEYGNATSGAFDLKLRNGNNEKFEYTGQVGFNGFELMAEGPIQKAKGSSFLASYRYSVLGVFQTLGINLGPTGVPKYQDLTFKVNLPNTEKISVEVFGIMGTSDIELLESKRTDENTTYGQGGRDVYFGSDMAVIGASFTKRLNNNAFLKTTIAQTAQIHRVKVDSVNLDNISEKYNFFNDNSRYNKTVSHTLYSQKINAKNTIKAGFIGTYTNFKVFQENLEQWPIGNFYWVRFSDVTGNTFQSQSYINWKHDFNQKMTLTTGIHHQYFFLNNTQSLEPRAAFRYAVNNKLSLNAGYGLHGQTSPYAQYFYLNERDPDQKKSQVSTNKNLDFYKSHHFVIGTDYSLTQDIRIKIETYYQSLYDVPVQLRPNATANSFSVLNSGADFGTDLRDHLVNKGTGTNKGVEFTVEKFFSYNYFFLVTGSFFDSKYKGSDNIERHTAFNGNYAINVLGGKDFKVSDRHIITLSGKTSWAGGRRYTPADIEISKLVGSLVVQQDKAFSLQYPDYFRIDVRVGYKMNMKKYTQEWAFDLQNATNQKNVLQEVFNPDKQTTQYEYQLGLIPMFLYRIQF